MKAAKRQFAALVSIVLAGSRWNMSTCKRNCHFSQLVPLARRPVSALFWHLEDAPGIRLPKPGSAA